MGEAIAFKKKDLRIYSSNDTNAMQHLMHVSTNVSESCVLVKHLGIVIGIKNI
jgi:hypothetical protein